MDWNEEYQRKLMDHDDAVKRVQSGDLVVIPLVGPGALAASLAKRQEELENVTVRLSSPTGDPGWYSEEAAKAFNIEFELFIGDGNRHVTDSLRGTYMPNIFSANFKAIDERPDEVKCPDVAFINVSAPNKSGWCNLGPHMWNKRSYARRARTVIAEVAPNQIMAHGDTWIHVSEIDVFVTGGGLLGGRRMGGEGPLGQVMASIPEEHRAAFVGVLMRAERTRLMQMLPAILPQIAEYTPEELAKALGVSEGAPEHIQTIAGYVRELVPDGATIQIGIGDPARWLVQLGVFDEKHDLGIHTELGCPGLAKLYEKGVVTNRKKTMHPGAAVAVAWTGCDNEDMAIIDDNPAFQLHDPEHILNLRTVSANENMIAINNAISVDVLGQINSESVFGGRMINGTGGQPEMHIGAFLARGGRGVSLLPSTAMDGAISRIVAQHDPGAVITIPRYYADTVVTEYGVARLAGKNHRQRAAELIAISHPDFRAELRKEAEKLLGKL
jgi:4-hydroxybutyrate CoA-transferase